MSEYFDEYDKKVRALQRELIRARELRDFTQTRVARLLGVTQQTLWNFESGKTTRPSPRFLRTVEALIEEWRDEEMDGGSYVLRSSPNFDVALAV